MIGVTDNKNKITEHLSRYVEQKQQTHANEEIDELRCRNSKFKSEIKELKIKLENCVTKEDIDALVQDIQNSFELFLNKTPRENDEILHDQIKTLKHDIENIHEKLESIGLNDMQILPAKKNVPNVPKLDIKPKIKK